MIKGNIMFTKKMKLTLTILLMSLLPLPAYAIDLKTAAQESAPKYERGADGKMEGLCIDIMKAIEKTDPQIKFNGQEKFLPFKRLQVELEKNNLDVFFGFKDSKKRLEKYNFLQAPLYQINYVVAVKADDDINISSLDDILALGDKGKILTVSSTGASKFLAKKTGLMIDDNAKSTKAMLKKLIAGQGRFAFYHDLGLHSIIKSENSEDKVKILPVTFLTYYHYIAFSKSVAPEAISQVESALNKVKDSGELTKIHAKYGLK